ncbi:MAG: hypothetical protein AAF657_31500, partial [Acidobacteriota bacterium]
MTTKSFSLWLLLSLLVGAALGAYLAVLWKDREIEKRVAEVAQVEQDKQAPLRDERNALRRALAREQLKVDAAGIAVEVERKNFGLARERLAKLGDALRAMIEDRGPEAAAIEGLLTQQAE